MRLCPVTSATTPSSPIRSSSRAAVAGVAPSCACRRQRLPRQPRPQVAPRWQGWRRVLPAGVSVSRVSPALKSRRGGRGGAELRGGMLDSRSSPRFIGWTWLYAAVRSAPIPRAASLRRRRAPAGVLPRPADQQISNRVYANVRQTDLGRCSRGGAADPAVVRVRVRSCSRRGGAVWGGRRRTAACRRCR